MNRHTANVGTNTTSTYEEDEWDFAVSWETGVCVEAIPQDVLDSLRVKTSAQTSAEPEFAVSGETGVCVEAISTSVRDILSANQVAPVAVAAQQNEPKPAITEEMPVQVAEMPKASEAPSSSTTTTHPENEHRNVAPIVKHNNIREKTALEDAEDELNTVLEKLYDLPFVPPEEIQNRIDRGELDDLIKNIGNPLIDAHSLSLIGKLLDRAEIWVKIIKTGKLDYSRIRDIGENWKVNKYHLQVRQAILNSNSLSSEQLTIFAISSRNPAIAIETLNTGKINRREDLLYMVEEYGENKSNAAVLLTVLKVGNFSVKELLSFAKKYQNPLLWEVLMKTNKVSLDDIKKVCGAAIVIEKMEAFGLKWKIEADAQLLSAKYATKEELIEALKRQALQLRSRNIFNGLL